MYSTMSAILISCRMDALLRPNDQYMHIQPSLSSKRYLPSWLDDIDLFLKTRLLPFGLFVQLTGLLWIGSSGGYITQTYIWCLFPGLISLLMNLYRNGITASVYRMTMGEKLLSTLLLWILMHPLLFNQSSDISAVFDRVLKIAIYVYVVRTVVLCNKRPEKLLLLAAGVATLFAVFTLIYQFGVLGHHMGVRALGIGGYRVGQVGIGEFAKDLNNPILAGLYYGCFASMICGYLAGTPFTWKKGILAICAVGILGLFILLTGSRGPLMAFLAMGLVTLLLCRHSWKNLLIFNLLFAGIALTGLLYQEITLQINAVLADGFNGRFVNWAVAVDYIKNRPFGYGAFAEYVGPFWGGEILVHPHNMFLNVSYHWGIPAGVLLIATILWGVWATIKNRNHVVMSIAAGSLVFGLIGMMTDTYSFLIRPDLQWLMLFFPIGLCSTLRKRDNSL